MQAIDDCGFLIFFKTDNCNSCVSTRNVADIHFSVINPNRKWVEEVNIIASVLGWAPILCPPSKFRLDYLQVTM